MAASAVFVATSSSVEVSNPASFGGNEADRAASVQTAAPETNDDVAMVDCTEYWIG
jgi:hypothetical protein